MNGTSASLPKVGDVISVDSFWVSETNMRYGIEFGESEGDKALIRHFRQASVVQPFKARPEKDGFGVVVGRRRFLAMKEAGHKEFIVGKHCWIVELSDEAAIDESLKENLEEFHNAPDPITRAEGINNYLSRLPTGVRGLARAWNMPASTLSEYLQVLKLSPGMQEVVRSRKVGFRDAVHLGRLKLGEEAQNELADLAREDTAFFKSELSRLRKDERGSLMERKRGIPKGVYFIDRIAWDKRYKLDMELLGEIDRRAETKNMKRDEWLKWFLRENIKLG